MAPIVVRRTSRRPFSPFFLLPFLLGSVRLLEAKYAFPYCQAEFARSKTYKPHPTYKLSMVQVVVRHGDRSPVNLALPYNRDVSWECNLSNHRAVGGSPVTLYNEAAYLIPGADEHPYAANIWGGNCTAGQLTLRGFEQLLGVGVALREIYVDGLRFLASQMAHEELYLRSTDIPRAGISAEALLLGMYPPDKRPQAHILQLWRKPLEIEDMFANRVFCPRYDEVKKQLYDSPEYKQRMIKESALKSELDRVMETKGLAGFEDDFNLYLDNLLTRACHGKHPPCERGRGSHSDLSTPSTHARTCITQDQVIKVLTVSDWSYEYLFKHQELNELAVGSFFYTLTAAMSSALNGKRPFKFGVYGAHDTTVGPLIGLLAGGIPDKRWPPYASSVIIELWEPHDRNPYGDPMDRNPDGDEASGEPLVRVIYNGRPVPVAVCQPGKVLDVQEEGFNEWCPFSKWQALAAEFTPLLMKEKCASNSKSQTQNNDNDVDYDNHNRDSTVSVATSAVVNFFTENRSISVAFLTTILALAGIVLCVYGWRLNSAGDRNNNTMFATTVASSAKRSVLQMLLLSGNEDVMSGYLTRNKNNKAPHGNSKARSSDNRTAVS